MTWLLGQSLCERIDLHFVGDQRRIVRQMFRDTLPKDRGGSLISGLT